MASTVEATRAQLKSIEKQLAALKKQAGQNLQEPAIPLINASVDAIASYDEDVALPLQNLLHYLSQLKTMLNSEEAKTLLANARQGCINLLVEMFSKNQQKLDSLQSGTSKLKEQYHSEFLESKEQLAQNFHQHKERPKATGYLGQLFQFFDFLEPLRKAEFINALHAQTIKFYRQTQVADTSFNHAHLPEMMQLEIMQRVIQQTLMDEPTFDIGILPKTSRTYQFFMKEMVGRYQGIVIGNLAIGDNNYEASRDWLTQINKVMKQPLQTYQFINEMDKFSANEQRRFDKTSAPLFSSQPLQDKSETPEEFKKLNTYDENFISKLLTLLDTAYPQSAILQFSNNKGGSVHSIAIAKDDRGIWLHDPKQYCVYFPNKVLGSDEAAQHFTGFFKDFHQRNYPNLTQVALIHLPEKRPASEKELSRGNQQQVQEREQPLLLGPGPGLNKQPSLELENPAKPGIKPKI
jgi:hypothetical protein